MRNEKKKRILQAEFEDESEKIKKVKDQLVKHYIVEELAIIII